MDKRTDKTFYRDERPRLNSTYLVIDVDNLFGLAEIGDMASVAGASALESRSDTLSTQPREDAATRLSVARVDGPYLKSTANYTD